MLLNSSNYGGYIGMPFFILSEFPNVFLDVAHSKYALISE